MIHRDWSTPRGFFLLFAILSIGACSGGTYTSEPAYPCGPFFIGERAYENFPLEWTPDGNLLIFRAGTTIGVVDAIGTNLRTLADANPGNELMYGIHVDISPDGRQVVYSSCEFPTGGGTIRPARKDFNYELVLVNLEGTEKQRLTLNTHLDLYPVWSPNGSRIAFVANPRSRHAELYVMAADGSDVRRVATTLIESVTERYGKRLATNALHTHWKRGEGEDLSDDEDAWLGAVALAPPLWSPDGKRLAFLVEEGEYGPYQKILYSVRADGTDLKRVAATEALPAWSPDGQRIALVTYAGDDLALYTILADGSDPKLITTVTEKETFEHRNSRYFSADFTLSWSPDGTQILYTCDFGACVVNVGNSEVTVLVEGTTKWDEETYIAVWSPDGARIALYVPGIAYYNIQLQLYTVARDGSDLRPLVRAEANGNLLPANPPE